VLGHFVDFQRISLPKQNKNSFGLN
jgi:hypothetical protein